MRHCPVLTKFTFAVDPVNATALLGSVYLSSHASGIPVHCDSFRCQQGHETFHKVYIIHLFKLNITETLVDGFSQKDLTKTSMILLLSLFGSIGTVCLFPEMFLLLIKPSSKSSYWSSYLANILKDNSFDVPESW